MRKSIYPTEAKTIGQRIRKKRMDLKWSLKTVAGYVGITEGYLSRIEADKQIPNPEVAGKIAEELMENVEEFISYSLQKYMPQNASLPASIKDWERLLTEIRNDFVDADKKILTNLSDQDRINIKKLLDRTYKKLLKYGSGSHSKG